MDKRRYKELFKDTMIFAIGTLGAKLISFLLLPLYTNILSSNEYGIADLVLTISELIRPFISISIYNALLRYGLSEEYRKEDVLWCATIVFIIGSILMFALTPLLSFFETISKWRWYLYVHVIAVFVHKNMFIYLKVIGKNKFYSVLSILQAIILAISNILLLVILKEGIRGYLLSNIFALVSVTVMAFLFGGISQDFKKSKYNRTLMKEMICYSLPFIANDIAWWLIHSSDKLMIERMLDTAMLGIYSAASKIPLLLTVFSSIFIQAWDISVVKEFEKENNSDYYACVFKGFLIVIFGGCILIIASIRPFMHVFIGNEFSDAQNYIPLLMLSAVFSSIASFVGSFYAALKKSRIIMLSTVIAGIVNVLLNYIFIRFCGIWGAVIGTVVAYLILAMIRLVGIRDYIRLHRHIFWLIALSIIVFCQAILTSLNLHTIYVSVIAAAAYFMVTLKDIVFIIQQRKSDRNSRKI